MEKIHFIIEYFDFKHPMVYLVLYFDLLVIRMENFVNCITKNFSRMKDPLHHFT